MTTANFAPKKRGRLSLAACKNYAAKAIFSAHIRKHLAISITIGLLLGTIGTASAALSAVTAKTIQGTAPYIKLNGTPLTNISELLSIQIGGDTYTSDASGNMQKVGTTGTFTTPITAASKFSDVTAIVPADGNPHVLSTAIPAADQVDDEGDSNFSLSGNVTATWKDQFGTTINTLTDPLQLCYSNYTLELTTTGTPSIETQYGDPRLTTYGNATALFKFSVPTTRIEPCWAKPDMTYATGQYAGPATMWDTSRGFIPQSLAASNSVNFPTAGANSLYFDLIYVGASDAPHFTGPYTVNGITVTVDNATATATSARVTITGPTSTTSPTIPTAMPAAFTLHGTDSAGSNIDYGFTLAKWYVGSDSFNDTPATHLSLCKTYNTNYRLPDIKELSNAAGTATASATPIPPFGTGASNGNWYQRYIGGGLYAEWGNMPNYPSAQILGITWTSTTSGTSYFSVSVGNGAVMISSLSNSRQGVCVYP